MNPHGFLIWNRNLKSCYVKIHQIPCTDLKSFLVTGSFTLQILILAHLLQKTGPMSMSSNVTIR